MNRTKYTPEIVEFVRVHVAGALNKELMQMVNERFNTSFTVRQITQIKKYHGLTSGLVNKGKPILYTPDIVDFVRDNAKGTPNKDLLHLVNERFNTEFTINQLKVLKHHYHIDSGLTGHFFKGQRAPNYGKKLSDEQKKKLAHTWFKTGNIPHNIKPIGSERINKTDGYIYIKTAEPNVWQLKHRTVWEEHNGPIPAGYNVSFLDGNNHNCSIDNLILTTNSELASMNQSGLRSADPELNKTLLNVVKLGIAIKKRLKKFNGAT